MDKLNLMVSCSGEYAPRFYEMSGGAFDEMLDAVRALSTRKFISFPHKAWKVEMTGVEQLRNTYNIESLPDLRLDRSQDSFETGLAVKHIVPPAGGSSFAIGKYRLSGEFQLREAKRWRRVGRLARARLVIEITEEQVYETIRVQNAEWVEHGLKPIAKPLSAIRRICNRAAEKYAQEVSARFAELTDGQRDEDTIYNAIGKLKQEKKI